MNVILVGVSSLYSRCYVVVSMLLVVVVSLYYFFCSVCSLPVNRLTLFVVCLLCFVMRVLL